MTEQNPRLAALAAAGVSIWLDDLSRERLTSGSLRQLIETSSVVGVTTNPTIFAAALSQGDNYAEEMATLRGKTTDEAIFALTTSDVQQACDLFSDVYAVSKGYDGRVSLEVDPRLANDTAGTIRQARQLYEMVARENVLIKIPATIAGLPAITETIAAGISVNVTLIFSVERYRAVMEAYMAGLEQARAAGHDLTKIHSVASFFVSRVDSEIDKRLEAIGTPEAKALTGKSALANARAAYSAFLEMIETPRWKALAASGANIQRPLWASTGTKNPAYPDTLYVAQLVANGVINTMPEKTLHAYADHGETLGDTLTPNLADAYQTLKQLTAVGIDLDDVYAHLESEGVEKFAVSWDELMTSVEQALPH